MKKRWLSILLATCMLATALPLTPIVATATATTTTATSKKDITLGTSAIQGPTEVTNSDGKYYTPNSYVYFGKNGATSIKWRVLDADKANDGTTAGMFLLSEYVLASGVIFNASVTDTYQGSNAQTWCQNFAANSANFSSAEQKAMLGVAKTDAKEFLYVTTWGKNSLTTNDKMFFLSARELADHVANYKPEPRMTATDAAGASAWWWLRSIDKVNAGYAGFIDNNGYIGEAGANYNQISARPALNLSPSSVLFTSAAVGGKATTGTTLYSNANYTGNEYKLTLLDESRSGFSASLKSVSGNTATVSYSGATPGANEYVSVIIRNGNTVKYYGRVAAVSDASAASGFVSINLPSDFNLADGDALYVFNEQYNGDKHTDYASAPIELNVGYPIRFNANGGTGTMDSQILAPDTATPLSANTFTRNGYSFVGWNTQADGNGTAYADQQSVKNLNTTLYAQWQVLPAEAPSVTCTDVGLTYGDYTDQIIDVTVAEQAGYTYAYQWYRGPDTTIDGETGRTYTVPNNLSAGSYDYYCVVTATRGDNGETATFKAKITVAVRRATVALTAPTAQNDITYGEKLSAVRLPDGWTWANSNTVPTVSNSGYTAYYVPTDVNNYDWTAVAGWNATAQRVEQVVAVTVRKASLTVTAKSAAITYGEAPTNNGVSYSGFVNGETAAVLDGTLTYDYSYTQYDGIGTSAIVPKGLTSDNYAITFANGTLTVNPKKISVTWSNVAFTFDGTAHKPTATTTDFVATDDVVLTVSGEKTEANTNDEAYVATVTITGSKAVNYTFAADAATTAQFTVSRAGQVKPTVQSTNETVSGKRDGSMTAVSSAMEYREEGQSTYTAISGSTVTGLAAGKYYVRFKGDANHAPSPEATVTIAAGRKLTVTVPATVEQIGYTLTVDQPTLDWHGQATITLALAAGYSPSTTEFAVKVNGAPISLDANGQGTIANAESDIHVTVTGVVDVTAPQVEMMLGTHRWDHFTDVPSLKLYFTTAQIMTVTATDAGSGPDKIEYYLSTTPLTEAEVAALSADQWTAYAGAVALNQQKEYLLYVKATDRAGNVTYISSEAVIVIDSIAPTVSGVVNGETYCSAQTVTVSDQHEVTVTVNGTPVTLDANGQFILSTAEGEQKIVVTDQVGNQSEVIVTVNDGHTGGTATCTKKAECAVCGEEYGEVDTQKHPLAHVAAVAATTEAEGHTEYWHCEGCHKYFSDKDGNRQIALADTVIAKLVKTDDVPTTSPSTGVKSHVALWLTFLLLSGGALIGRVVYGKKEKHFTK